MEKEKRGHEAKFLLLFEAAKRSLLTCDMLFAKIKETIKGFESSIDNAVDLGDKIALPLIEASGLIDYAHRFSSVVDALPIVKKKSPQMERLRQAMKLVVEVRNYLQHMRGDLSTNDTVDYAILGSLSWISNDSCYSIFMSQPSKAESVGITYDTVENKWLTNYQYEINKKIISLEDLLSEMHLAFDFVNRHVTFSDPEFSKLKWGPTLAISTKVLKM